MMKKNIGLFLILALVYPGCFGAPVKDTLDLSSSENRDVKVMLDTITSINENSPLSFTASFLIDGSVGKKKFKSFGEAEYDGKVRMMSITFLDYIFKSAVTMMFQDGNDISIYFPVEKKIVRDNFKTINLLNNNDVDVDFRVVYALMTGRIPLIEDYSVKKGLVSSDDNTSYLILENDLFYETISFSGKQPDRIKLLHKKTKKSFEIYFRKFKKHGKSRFFSEMTIISSENDAKIDIKFNRIKLNIPLRVKTIKDVKLPKGVKVIRL